MSESSSEAFMFRLVRDLGLPEVFPTWEDGKLPAAIQFVIPNLHISQNDKEKVADLVKNCCPEVYDIKLTDGQNDETQEPATLVTVAFYIRSRNTINGSTADDEIRRDLHNTSHGLMERVLGVLSLCAGMKVSSIQRQITVSYQQGKYKKILPPAGRASIPKISFSIPQELCGKLIPDYVFSALLWLRRGLAERDPIETFSAFTVCLQILARELVTIEPTIEKCPSCGAELKPSPPSITSLVKELVVSRLGADLGLFKRLWDARNAVVAHGGRSVTANVFLDLTELKFDAADLAFRGIKLALGLPLDSKPSPNQAFFITDALMYAD